MIINFDEFLVEGYNYLEVYKNHNSSNFTVLKGNELYDVNYDDKKLTFKYLGKVDRKKFTINGRLLSGEKYKGFFILLQKELQH
jgi:hypothetical protein